jgi:two-component system, LytTR family, sensor kinase
MLRLTDKSRVKSKIQWVKGLLLSSIISIVIGTSFLWIGTHSSHISLSHYLMNTGYSLNLGLALFANGALFRLVEKGWLSWVNHPFKSLLIALAFHFIYSTIVIFSCNWFWFIYLRGESLHQFLSYGWFIIGGEYFILFLITAIIYAQSFFKEWREQVIQKEKLTQEAVILQLQVMQNQVNPHFLFNSLNTLGSLIDIDKEKAKHFTRELSQFYRELLHFKDKELIPLHDEINFVKKYIYLQKIRFADNFDVRIQLDKKDGGEVIPMSIQMMVENAVKHNKLSKEHPLKISIYQPNETEIVVENNYQPKENIEGSNKIGLENLTQRYRFLTNKELRVEKTDEIFRVTFPIVRFE